MSAEEPWGSGDDESYTNSFRFSDNFKPTDNFQDTESYVASLEAKLARLKGKGREVTAREMLSVLERARQDQSERLISPVFDFEIQDTSFLPGEECSDVPLRTTFIERKLFPERQALTQEEVQHLLEADYLGKATTALSRVDCESGSISSGDSEPNR
ncbi:coiled-coil domain-containing protein 32-like [Ornithodoros turicata]